MKKTMLLLSCYDGLYEVFALVDDCGLAVHHHLACKGFYAVSHVASGKMVCWDLVFNTPEEAFEWIGLIRDVLPWQQCAFDGYDWRTVRRELIRAYERLSEHE